MGSGGSDDRIFRRLAYEVAFSEYAIALASEMAAVSYYLDVSEPIVDIRETLNPGAARGSALRRRISEPRSMLMSAEQFNTPNRGQSLGLRPVGGRGKKTPAL
jgi:hypothetical protein